MHISKFAIKDSFCKSSHRQLCTKYHFNSTKMHKSHYKYGHYNSLLGPSSQFAKEVLLHSNSCVVIIWVQFTPVNYICMYVCITILLKYHNALHFAAEHYC